MIYEFINTFMTNTLWIGCGCKNMKCLYDWYIWFNTFLAHWHWYRIVHCTLFKLFVIFNKLFQSFRANIIVWWAKTVTIKIRKFVSFKFQWIASNQLFVEFTISGVSNILVLLSKMIKQQLKGNICAFSNW